MALTLNHHEISVRIEGSLPAGLDLRLADEIRGRAEAVFKSAGGMERF